MSDQTYIRIAENIDKGMQTAPKADDELSVAFIAYLKIVYTPEEAALVQHLSMNASKTVEELADATGLDVDNVRKIISPLAEKAAVQGRDKYRLPAIPSLLNLHMFYPDIKPDDLEAAKLYQEAGWTVSSSCDNVPLWICRRKLDHLQPVLSQDETIRVPTVSL